MEWKLLVRVHGSVEVVKNNAPFGAGLPCVQGVRFVALGCGVEFRVQGLGLKKFKV